MYRASDELANEEQLAELEAAADDLDLGQQARSNAAELFLSNLPDEDRAKQPALATALYVGALLAGEERSQGAVATAVGVSRLSIQQRWKRVLEDVGLDAPEW